MPRWPAVRVLRLLALIEHPDDFGINPLLAGLALCVFLRLMAIYRGWRVPAAPAGSGEEA